MGMPMYQRNRNFIPYYAYGPLALEAAKGMYKMYSAYNSPSGSFKGSPSPLAQGAKRRIKYDMPFQTVKKVAVDRNNPYYKSPARGVHRSRRFRQWSQPARSTGKFRRARRVTKRNPNTRQSIVRNKFMKAGISGTLETNGSFSTTSQVTCLTVASKSQTELQNELCYCIIKKIALKAGLQVHDVGKQLVFDATHVVNAHYRTSQAVATVVDNIKASGTDNTIAGVASALKTSLDSRGTGDMMIGISIENVISVDAINYNIVNKKYIDLERASYLVHDKTTIKIQNRTTAGIGAEQNDNRNAVDAVPVHGKILEGNGRNPVFSAAGYGASSGQEVDFEMNENSGLSLFQSTVDSVIREPPTAKMIKSSYKESKLHLDPGQIKTYTLLSSRRVTQATILRIAFTSHARENSPIKDNDRTTKYVQFWFEKMINTDGDNPVEIAYEVNRNLSISCTPKTNRVTAPYFDAGTAVY